MTKRFLESQFNLKKDWRSRRNGQGYSYAEVLREITRRRKGEYILPKENADQAFEEGARILALRYKLAALLSDFLECEGVTREELVALLESDAADTVDAMLDPFPCGDREESPIESCALVDTVYPCKQLKVPGR
jgi:hypothetical protein